mgnify:CR=1 FL=1
MSKPATFTDIIPADSLFGKLRTCAPDAWQSYVCHDFIKQLGNGTLPEAAFKHYLIQDYLFLIQFSRAYALAVYKAEDLHAMRQFSGTVHAILDMEMKLHLEFCEGWGLSEADIIAQPEARACIAYTRYVLDRGHQGDVVDLQVALMPCMVGYAEIANRLTAIHIGHGLKCMRPKNSRTWQRPRSSCLNIHPPRAGGIAASKGWSRPLPWQAALKPISGKWDLIWQNRPISPI